MNGMMHPISIGCATTMTDIKPFAVITFDFFEVSYLERIAGKPLLILPG